MTETEENELLVAAETRRLEKVARMPAPVRGAVSTPSDSLEESLKRLGTLSTKPIQKPAVDDRAEKVKAIRDKAGIPKRHDHAIPEADTPWNVKRADCVKRMGSGFMVALTGKQGTGKTQLAAALIYEAASRLWTCRFACAMDFFIDLKASFGDDAESREAAVVARYANPKLLVLDEMDERSESAWENRLLFHMLNKRYNSMVDTVLISRRSKDEFLQSVGTSIQSRLQETGGIIECTWPSFRERR